MEIPIIANHNNTKMEVTIEKKGESLVCSLVGRLDALAAQPVTRRSQPLLQNADKEIILDCSKLEYISSSGLRILLLIRKEAYRKGGKTIITGLSDDIRQVLLVTGFINLFEIR